MSFAIISGSYDVFSPLYSLVMDWVFKDLRTLDVCLAVRIWGDNGIPRDSLDVCFGDQLAGSAHEPMHRGWHTFSSWFSGRNFGALFEVLCVGWIDESEIVWCISYNHTHGYLRWHWSIYVTLGFWLMCVLRCYFTTNSRDVCDTYRNSPMDWSERIIVCSQNPYA